LAHPYEGPPGVLVGQNDLLPNLDLGLRNLRISSSEITFLVFKCMKTHLTNLDFVLMSCVWSDLACKYPDVIEFASGSKPVKAEGENVAQIQTNINITCKVSLDSV
jgi:hypothetical protein